MALIKCPECGKEISSKARACPNCGYPLKKSARRAMHELRREAERAESQKAAATMKKSVSQITRNLVVSIVLILILGIVYIISAK